SLRDEVATGIAHIEGVTGKRFGNPADPLLVSVRSGARASMPGMMDTVLNLGLNDQTVEGLAATSGDARFAWDSYRRFIQMY
ncbi:PEP/pyruvate-binding domain-containing protein, partial [Acinetobacter baumannii]